MKLSDWLTREKLTDAEFGRRVKKSKSSVGRWRAGARVPRPDEMRSILEATRGEVQPNDFYDLPGTAAESQGAAA